MRVGREKGHREFKVEQKQNSSSGGKNRGKVGNKGSELPAVKLY